MKKLKFKVKHCNWGLKSLGDWNSIEWKIYEDLTVEIEESYMNLETKENTKYNCKITSENYSNLIKNINLAKQSDSKVYALDGDAWEIIEYNNGKDIWKRDTDYIYGISSLENIAKILNDLIKINKKSKKEKNKI